jgi:hypothetical protein
MDECGVEVNIEVAPRALSGAMGWRNGRRVPAVAWWGDEIIGWRGNHRSHQSIRRKNLFIDNVKHITP